MGRAQMPSIFLARLTSDLATSTSPTLRRCFLRLPVVGAEANAAPDLRRAWRRRSFPDPLTLKRCFAPECVLFFGMSRLSRRLQFGSRVQAVGLLFTLLDRSV